MIRQPRWPAYRPSWPSLTGEGRERCDKHHRLSGFSPRRAGGIGYDRQHERDGRPSVEAIPALSAVVVALSMSITACSGGNATSTCPACERYRRHPVGPGRRSSGTAASGPATTRASCRRGEGRRRLQRSHSRTSSSSSTTCLRRARGRSRPRSPHQAAGHRRPGRRRRRGAFHGPVARPQRR